MIRAATVTVARRRSCAVAASSSAISRSSWFAPAIARRAAPSSRGKATQAPHSPLEGDAGAMGTKVHHALAKSMAVLVPAYLLVPDSMTESWMHRSMGVLLGANIGMHAWIGLNYVVTDYVPKVSHALLVPARYATAGLAVTILLGLTKISLASPGGIKAVLKGVWNGKRKEKFDF